MVAAAWSPHRRRWLPSGYGFEGFEKFTWSARIKRNPTGQYSKAVTRTKVSARSDTERDILEGQAIHVRAPGFG